MARALGIPVERLEIEAGAIGGDFGGKSYSIGEHTCYLLAGATGRPVKAVMRYADELAAMNVRQAARIRLRTVIDQNGRLLAHDADVLFDGGACVRRSRCPACRWPAQVVGSGSGGGATISAGWSNDVASATAAPATSETATTTKIAVIPAVPAIAPIIVGTTSSAARFPVSRTPSAVARSLRGERLATQAIVIG